MNPVPWKQTITGRVFPMAGFTASDIDLHGDVAPALARICRYGGHVPGNPYSVAQHCCIGADAALEETSDANLAAYVLLHDAHEAYFGDMTTPVERWLTALELELFGTSNQASALISTAKARLDTAIWRAAGLPPPGRTYRDGVKSYDLRLLATERLQLLMHCPISWGAEVEAAQPIRMRGRISAWPVAKAIDEYQRRLDDLCPNAMRV